MTAWALDGSVEESQICEMPVSLPLAGSLVDWNTINDPVRLSDELLLVPCPRLTWTSPPLASRKYICWIPTMPPPVRLPADSKVRRVPVSLNAGLRLVPLGSWVTC